MVATSYHSPTIQRELAHQILDVDKQHEINFSLIISSVLIAVALTALLWLVTTTLNQNGSEMLPPGYSGHGLPVQYPSPTADIAEHVVPPVLSQATIN